MIRPAIIALAVVAIAHDAVAQDEFFVRASRRAVVRDQPSTSANDLERLDAGDERVCIADADGDPRQVDGFYEIRTAASAVGFVSRFTVRLHRGQPAVTPTTSTSTTNETSGTDESRHTDAELEAFRQEHAGRFGLPVGETQLVSEGFVTGYDPRLKIPAWVQWRLTEDDIGNLPKADSFRPDGRIPTHQQSIDDDYDTEPTKTIWAALGMTRESNTDPTLPNFYARGHIVPDKSQSRTADLQRDTYVFTNMAPQVQNGFNGGTWLSLENRIRGWCEDRGPLTIIAGPIFDSAPRMVTPELTGPLRRAVLSNDAEPTVKAQPPTERQVVYNVIGANEVAVPAAFFCVVVDDNDANNIQALGFIIDNASVTSAQGRTLESTLRSIATIQERTGLDLLSALPDDVEGALEATTATELWN